MAEKNLKELENERDAQFEDHIRGRISRLGPLEARMEMSYKQAVMGAYISAASVIGGLGIIYGPQVYEAVKNLF